MKKLIKQYFNKDLEKGLPLLKAVFEKFRSQGRYWLFFEVFQDLFYFFLNIGTSTREFFNREHLHRNIRTLYWNKLDTYIMRQFTLSILGATILFVSIYELAQIFQEMRMLPEDVNYTYLYLYYLNTVPYWTLILQQFGFLFATVYVLSRLSSTREMVAMVSTGTSIYRLTFYMMLISTIYYICTVTFIMDKFIFPCYQKSYIYKKVAYNQAKIGDLKFLSDNRKFTIFGANNLLYLGDYYNATDRYIDNATIVQYMSEDEIVSEQTILAPDKESQWLYDTRIMMESLKDIRVPDRMTFVMRIDAQKIEWEEEAGAWKIVDGVMRTIEEGGRKFVTSEINNKIIEELRDPYTFFEKNWYPIDAMTVKEAEQHIDKLKRSGRGYHSELTKFYAKDAYPLGVIFVVMVGVGIVNMASKTVSVPVNSAISMALFVLYYLLYTSFLGIAGRGSIPPIWGGYAGSIIFGVIALILYGRTTT